MSTNKKQGISLIVLVITIVVIIILAGAVILTISNNNPIESANKATFLNDLTGFQEQLELYKGKEYVDAIGNYDPVKLQADDSSVTYGETIYSDKNIVDVIPALKNSKKYAGQFKVIDGKLIYQGSNTKMQELARDNGVDVIIIGEPIITITNPSENVVEQGVDIKYTVKFTSNAALTTIDLTGKVELVTDSGIAVNPQPEIIVGTVSGTSTDVTREVEITVKTSALADGGYKLKIKSGTVTNADGLSNISDKISLSGFDVDSEAPTNPQMSASPTDWTNESVLVKITYPNDAIVKEYSTDGTTWQTYISDVTVTANNTIVYARCKDAAGNESGQSSLTVVNIDKNVPTVIFGTNGATNVQTASTKITFNDVGGSNLNSGTLQYIWDTQNTATPESGWTVFTNDDTLTKGSVTGTYYLWVKATDNAGNSLIEKSNAFIINNTPPENPILSANVTGWTNVNVTVTITYPDNVTVKEYSLNGTTWQTYTSGVTVTTNNTTVYARCKDAAGNESGQSTLTVSNIDKTTPTVVYGTNGATNVQSVSTTITVSDLGGSSLNEGTLQYIWDTQNTTTPTSGWTVFTNGDSLTKGNVTGTYYLWVKATDNAGNVLTTKSNAFVLNNTPPTNPTISANPTTWTSGNVTVTITYPGSATVKEYSLDATTWQTYTSNIIVTTNDTTIYAKCKDAAGNQSGQSTLTVSNIDKTAPTIVYDTNGSTSVKTASTAVNAGDVGGSGVNASTLQYVWATQNTITPSSGWVTFTNGQTLTKGSITGTYYLWIKCNDNVGNSIVTKSNAFEIDNTVPTNPTMSANPTTWTNGDVSITITYPSDASIKEYSFDATNWLSYTTIVPISTNNTTIYARCKDAAGNQSGQSSLTVANIDKVVPTVVFGTNGSSVESFTAATTVTVSDAGGSSLNTSSLQYVWSTELSAPVSGWTTFTNGNSITASNLAGTYYLWIKGSDNAGNLLVEKSNSFLLKKDDANKPELAPGMIAKKWNGTSWVTVTNPDTDIWYNYGNKEWANAQTADGSMWVWIPRYIYKISTGWHTNTAGTIDIQFTRQTDDNWNSALIGNINTDTSANASNNTWTNHPAFTFGSTELKGIWVAKFEATARESLATTYGTDNVTTKHVKILPNVKAWACINISNAFTVSRNMETDSTYGWGTSGNGIDTHLMKNIEWGATAYLSHSQYGRSGVEISKNTLSGSYLNSTLDFSYTGQQNYTYYANQSTTGNITGIYDMSGGNYEWVAAYLNNGNASLNNYGSSLSSADIKYKDIYNVITDSQANNYSNTLDKKGDAIYETSNSATGDIGWFGDTVSMPYNYSMFFVRSSERYTNNGGVYCLQNHSGTYQPNYGFRPTLLVDGSL